MITQLATIFILGLLFAPQAPFWGVFTIDTTIYSTSELSLSGPQDQRERYYLAQSISFPPVQNLRKDIEAAQEITLKHRGEAHITVITPPEYHEVLSEFISRQEIDQLADAFNLQESHFNIRCLGRGAVKKEESEKETYFLVVQSPRLYEFRRKIQVLYEARGGVPGAFLAHHYFPHITVGFTHHDLHYSDGIIKNQSRCWARVRIKDQTIE